MPYIVKYVWENITTSYKANKCKFFHLFENFAFSNRQIGGDYGNETAPSLTRNSLLLYLNIYIYIFPTCNEAAASKRRKLKFERNQQVC